MIKRHMAARSAEHVQGLQEEASQKEADRWEEKHAQRKRESLVEPGDMSGRQVKAFDNAFSNRRKAPSKAANDDPNDTEVPRFIKWLILLDIIIYFFYAKCFEMHLCFRCKYFLFIFTC